MNAVITPVSPYAGRRISPKEHFSISAYWFATNFHWGALLLIVLPNEMRRLNPGFKAETLGFLTGFGAIMGLLVPLFVSALSDRCAHPMGRRRPFIAIGVLLNLLGLGLMGWASASAKANPAQMEGGALASILGNPGIVLFFLAFLVVQLGNNVASASYMGVIPDVVPEDQRGIASGWMAAQSQGGTLLGAIGCGVLLGGASGTMQIVLIGVMLLAIAPFTIFGMRENPLATRPPAIRWGAYIRSLWIDPRQHPNYAWVWITRFLVMLGFYAILPFINYYLVDIVGIEQDKVSSTAPILLGVILVASTITGLLGGSWSDKVGRKKVVYVSNAAIAIIAPLFIFTHSLELALIVGVLFGLAYGAYISVDYALGTDVLPSKSDAAKEMAVWHIAMTLPQSIAAPLAGVMIASFGKIEEKAKEIGGDPIVHYTVNGYASIFVLCAVCFGLGAVLLRNLRGIR